MNQSKLLLLALLFSGAFLFVANVPTQAGSATWNLNPTSGDWNTAANWTPNTVPNGPTDVATFAVSNVTEIAVSVDTTVGSIVYNAGASAFTITANPSVRLTLTNKGITNNSGTTQTFVAEVPFGDFVFLGNATAGDATIVAKGGTVESFYGGSIAFNDNSTAGNATIILNPGVETGEGRTVGGLGGFYDSADGGTSRFIFLGSGSGLYISGSEPVSIGSIEGFGGILIDGDRPVLVVGSNNLSTHFSGGIVFYGPFSKIGTGTLTLTTKAPGHGRISVNEGTLIVNTPLKSGLAHGTVTVDGGTLGGSGMIAGLVTVGSRSGAESFLAPAAGTSRKATLTLQSSLSLKRTGIYSWTFTGSGTQVESDLVIANGVTIGGANIDLIGQGTLDTGLVLTVINNTSPDPINGTFSNLADGAIVTVNGNDLQADYEGGDGNDLTLTVQ